MKIKSLHKALAIFLALGMLISYLPTSARAQAPNAQDEIILESGPQTGTGDALNLGDPLPANYQLSADGVDLVIDDGVGEATIGSSGGEVSILALNRFSPETQFPFLLTEISFLSNHANGSVLAPGQPIRLVVFQNTNEGVSDPSNGAELRLEVYETVKVSTGWNVYQLDQPLLFEGPGDVLIGVLFEYHPGTAYFPVVVDIDSLTQRSWVGLWPGIDTPSPITIPPTAGWGEIGELGVPGTITIRGKGIFAGDSELAGTVTNATTTAPLAKATVSATLPTGSFRSATTDVNGNYNLSLDAGTYTITTSKLGYTSKTETVTIPEGLDQPFVKDFALEPLPATILTGTVKDGGITSTINKHGYPLYTKLSFTAMGETEETYSDPFTGEYEISLFQDIDYTIKVESLTTTYPTYTESFTSTVSEQSKNFELFVPALDCNTAGYSTSGSIADFDNNQLPTGWTNYDYLGNGQVWQFDDPGNKGNKTGGTGGFAILDSDNYGGGGSQHTGLRTPMMDFTTADSVILEFDSYHHPLTGQTAMVRYSIDGGNTWATKLSVSGDGHDLKAHHYIIDLSDELIGESQAMIEFKFQASWGYYWQIDNVSLGDPTCKIRNGGAVTGYVFNVNENNVKLIDAKVETASSSDTTTARADEVGNGLYWFFQDTTENPEDVEFAVSKLPFETTVETETVEQSVINHFDFELGYGHLAAIPETFEVNMNLGEADRTETLVLENDGKADITWSIREKNVGFTPQKVNIPAFTGEIEVADEIDMGPKPQTEISTGSGLRLSSEAENFGIASLVPAYGVDIVDKNNDLYKWTDVTAVGTSELIGISTATQIFAGDFLGSDFNTMYVASYTNNNLYSIETADASTTLIGPINPPEGTHISGLTGTDELMYAVASQAGVKAVLGTVNLTTGEFSTIGQLSKAKSVLDLAYIPSTGLLYAIDLATASLYSINPETGADTLVGPLGVTPKYAQGMDYDEENGILYWAACNDAISELRIIDINTGASAKVGDFLQQEVDAFAIAAGGIIDRIPWLDENVLKGELEADEQQEIELTFTVANMGQPGTFEGELIVNDDSPYEDLIIPVTLNVSRPVDYGSFKGTIYALEQCDIEPALVKNATVIFSQDGVESARTQTDENGNFSYAMLNGKYDIEIELDGYVSKKFECLELAADEDYIIDDVNLRLDAPCLILDPDSLIQEQFSDRITEQTLTFVNTGAKETVFEITERDMGGPSPFFLGNSKAAIELKMDDGTIDTTVGEGGMADFIAVNRFTPAEDQFPMTLTEVSVYFEGKSVASGQPFKVLIYQNTSGNDNPAEGSEFLYQQPATIGAIPGWTVVTLDQPVVLQGPGDVLIGGLFTHKPGSAYYPAALDKTSSQQRSWVGVWSTPDAPGTPTLPPDASWMMIDRVEPDLAGNWMIRANGFKGDAAGTGGDILWLDIDNLADVVEPDGGQVDVTLTFDSTGLFWGDYYGQLLVTNLPDPRITIPVQLRVLPFSWQYLPLINNGHPLPAK